MKRISRGPPHCNPEREISGSVFCMTELHELYLHSRSEKTDFLRRIIPLTLADACIDSIRNRANHARYWKSEKEEHHKLLAEGLLGPSDCLKALQMTRWAL